MKHYHLEYSPQASQDADGIHDWLQSQSYPATADRFVDGLRLFCKGLETFPIRGTIHRYRGQPVRIIGYKRAVSIVFMTEGDIVRILRLLYRGRDTSVANRR